MGCTGSVSRPPQVENKPPEKNPTPRKQADEDDETRDTFGNDLINPGQLGIDNVASIPASISAGPSFFNLSSKFMVLEYRFVRHVGHGAQSDVFLVEHSETMEQFAAKVYDKSYLFRTSIGDTEQPIQKLYQEFQIMNALNSPNCLKLVEVIDDDCTNSVILILPFANAGSLSSHSWKSEKISEEEAKDTFAQIARGLKEMHSLNIIHRDLKPDNILKFSSGKVCIADFSVSKMLDHDDELLEDTDGTPAFYSPEECAGDAYYGKPADIWAFGIMIYVMIYGKLPFFDDDDEGVFFSQFMRISQKIINDEFEFPESVKISDDLRDLFSHVLDKNPQTRYTISQILEHPWLKDVPDRFPYEEEEEVPEE